MVTRLILGPITMAQKLESVTSTVYFFVHICKCAGRKLKTDRAIYLKKRASPIPRAYINGMVLEHSAYSILIVEEVVQDCLSFS